MDRRTTGTAALPEQPLRILAIAAGGSLGTLARYGLARALAPSAFGFPWPTLLANVLGSLLLGLTVTLVVERWSPTRFVRPFVAIGFCGGFTTFSTMMVETTQLGRHGHLGLASVYLIASVGAGLAAGALGIALARRGLPVTGRRAIPDPDDVGQLGDDPLEPLGSAGQQLGAPGDELDPLGESGRP